MADTLINNHIDRIGQYACGKASAAISLKLRLFVSNTAITTSTTLSSLTTCTAPGYADIAIATAGSWTGSTTGGVATYSYPAQTFTLTGQGSPAQTIYGHVVWDLTSTTACWALLWSTPYAIPAGGGQVQVVPSFTLQNC